MPQDIKDTGERIIADNLKSKEDYLLYLRHLFAYEYAREIIPKASVILEVGCGEGYGTSLLSKYVTEIIGLDTNKETIIHAQKKYETANCYFVLYNGEKIPFEDCTFDGVVSFQVVEHVKDDKEFVLEINRVLKKDAVFICTTPNREYRLRPGQKPWNPFHVREYYAFELENLLKPVFRETKILGIRGNEEVQGIEINRLKQNPVVSLDIFNLRRFLPNFIRRSLITIISKAKERKGQKENLRAKYSIKDFYVVNDVSQGLDILGICGK